MARRLSLPSLPTLKIAILVISWLGSLGIIGGTTESPTWILWYHITVIYEVFSGVFNLGPITPKDYSISDGWYDGSMQKSLFVFSLVFIQVFAATAVAMRKLYFQFLSHWMGYDHGDSFLLDSEPNGIQFGWKSKGNLSPWSYPIQCERNWRYSFISVWSRSQRDDCEIMLICMPIKLEWFI